MSLSRRLAILAFLAFAAQTVPAAMAQTPPVRVRGSIAGLSGDTLSVVTREGPTVSVALPAGFQPSALKKLGFDDIKPNSYVASVAAPNAAGELQAVYVNVFSEAQRGVGEGHYDWDLMPGSSMTNATVTAIVTPGAGRKLSLVYKGTPIEITVPPSAIIMTGIPASRDDLKPGAKVFITATKAADGSLTASRVTVGKDGVDPPQ